MWYNHRYDLIRRDTHVGKPIKLPCLNLMKPSHVCRRTHTNTSNTNTHFLRLTDTNFFFSYDSHTYIHTRVLATMIMFSILIMTTVMISEMKIVMHKGTIMTSMRKMMIMMKMRMTMMMWAILITTHND